MSEKAVVSYVLDKSSGPWWDISRGGDVVMNLDKAEYTRRRAQAYVDRYNAKLPAFDMRQVGRNIGKGWGSAAGSEYVDCHDLAHEAFGKLAADGNVAMAAMAYLWRRFGPPAFGTDPYKCIAHWMLSTPDPDVHLSVDPNPSGLAYSFRYVVRSEVWYPLCGSPADYRRWEDAFQKWFLEKNPDFENTPEDRTAEARKLYSEWRFDSKRIGQAEKAIGRYPGSRDQTASGKPWRERPEPVPRVNQSLLDAMRELLRPVGVRDSSINLLGLADGVDMPPAERSKYAGLGVPPKAMDELLSA